MMEVWRDIKGYEGLYQVSNLGRVKSHTKVLHLNTNNYGYKHVTLSKGGVRKTALVHRMVATAFVDNPLGLPQINHKDGDKDNNDSSNLEWVTQKINNCHAIHTNLRKVKKILLVGGDNAVIREFNNRMEINEFLGRDVCQDLITRCCNGKRKSAYGYVWRYA